MNGIFSYGATVIGKEINKHQMESNMYNWIDWELEDTKDPDTMSTSIDLRKESVSMMNEFSDYMFKEADCLEGITNQITTLDLPVVVKQQIAGNVKNATNWIHSKRNAVFGPIVSGDVISIF